MKNTQHHIIMLHLKYICEYEFMKIYMKTIQYHKNMLPNSFVERKTATNDIQSKIFM